MLILSFKNVQHFANAKRAKMGLPSQVKSQLSIAQGPRPISDAHPTIPRGPRPIPGGPRPFG